MHRLTIFFAALTLFACGGSDDPTPPTCQAGELAVTGTVDNTQVNQRLAGLSVAFQNGGIDTGSGPEEGMLSAQDSNGGSPVTIVSLDFKDLIADGHSGSARGYVDFSTLSGPHVGNCETGDFVSTISIDKDGKGGTFVLRDLHDSPFCSGTAHSGALAGCWRYTQ